MKRQLAYRLGDTLAGLLVGLAVAAVAFVHAGGLPDAPVATCTRDETSYDTSATGDYRESRATVTYPCREAQP